jgi:hypothetical protein
MKVEYSHNRILISDQLFDKNNPEQPNIGCLVILYSRSADKEIGRDITKKWGNYLIDVSADDAIPGTYELRFYGSNTIPRLEPFGDWILFTIEDRSNLPIVFEQTPTFTVSEISGKAYVDVNNSEQTYAQFNWTNLSEAEGILKTILIYSKRSDEEFSSDYTLFAEVSIPPFNSSWSGNYIQGVGGLNLFKVIWKDTPTPSPNPLYKWNDGELKDCILRFSGDEQYKITDNLKTASNAKFSFVPYLIGDGTKTTFNFTLDKTGYENMTIIPGSLRLDIWNGKVFRRIVYDDFDSININYTTGVGTAVFKTALATGEVGYFTYNLRRDLTSTPSGSPDSSGYYTVDLGVKNVYQGSIYLELTIGEQTYYLRDTNGSFTDYDSLIDYDNGLIKIKTSDPFTIKGSCEVYDLQVETVLALSTQSDESIDLSSRVIDGNSFIQISAASGEFTFSKALVLYKKPCGYDFYCVYLNTTRQQAQVNGITLSSYCYDVTFDGVPDYNQITEVKGLRVANLSYKSSDDVDGLGFSTSKQLLTANVDLRWRDISTYTREEWVSTLFKTATGEISTITYDQSRLFSDYVVYMFLSKAGLPPLYKRPGLNLEETEPNGTWYFVGSFPTNYAKISCGWGEKVAFWVGFRTKEEVWVNSTSTVNDPPTYGL